MIENCHNTAFAESDLSRNERRDIDRRTRTWFRNHREIAKVPRKDVQNTKNQKPPKEQTALTIAHSRPLKSTPPEKQKIKSA
jgi:hypothetical protein